MHQLGLSLPNSGHLLTPDNGQAVLHGMMLVHRNKPPTTDGGRVFSSSHVPRLWL